MDAERHSAEVAPTAHGVGPDGGLAAARGEFASLALGQDRRVALGLFLRHLARGERLAQRSAGWQSALARDFRASRFFRSQARQEAMHARVFDTFATWLDAPHLALAPCPYDSWETRIDMAAAAGNYLETVVATQVVLEALGETLLGRLDAGLDRAGAGFKRLRGLLRAQEAAHHAFGTRTIAVALAAEETDVAALRAVALPYLALAEAMIAAGAPATTHFALTSERIASDFRAHLPSWLGQAA